ncbi:MAG: hypothetical protein J6A94_09550 [Lachnospiraceae bacterium]|nr:hypothetical protein [Lachnospiraceae bacterium]
MKITTRIENGKAYLEFDFAQELASVSEEKREDLRAIFIQIQDKDGGMVLQSLYPLKEEEPACAILLHPHLWNGLEDPYLYQVVLHFINTEETPYEERCTYPLAIYTFEEMEGKGWFLNGKAFEPRVLKWDISNAEEGNIQQILEAVKEMGINTLQLSCKEPISRELIQICIERGFLIREESQLYENLTESVDCNILFSHQPLYCTDVYYHYKAKWSKVPFVYISMCSIQKNKKHNLSLTVYSNQKKVALYTNGTLFEFLAGGPEYFFEEIPIKKYPLTITAEAGECRTAITLYETSHNFHRTVTFS